jgi:hypothetical protein
MHCLLLAPGLFAGGAAAPQRLPAAETLIAKGRKSTLAFDSADAWLLERFGVARQRDWPVAPFALLGDGGAPGDHHWLRADPVHLVVDRDRLVLGDAARLEREEAESLVEALNAHFAGELVLHPMRPDRWYARLPAAPDLVTVPRSRALGAGIEPNLPTGGDARRFRVLVNEAQMLLHAHPVNAAREARGEPPVNSVWLWGGGALAAARRPGLRQVLADDPLARGLALAAGVPAAPLPADAAGWLAQAPGEGVVVVVPGERGPAELERDWLAPLLAALRASRIGMVTLLLPAGGSALEVETVRSDLRHFWRRRRPVAEFAP